MSLVWLVLALCLLLPRGGFAQAGNAPRGLEEIGIEQKLDAQVPRDLQFRDAQGRAVRLGELLEDRPVILNLIYFECPMLCNLATNGLIRSLRTLSFDVGEEFTVITVSFDPREGPELAAASKRTALQRYGRNRGTGDWHFLTGRKPAIDALSESVGFRYRYDSEKGEYAHAAGLIVLTPEGRVSRYLLGIEYPARDLRLSLIEAADNQIGTVSDQVLLLCYQYDPTTGKYGLLIQNVLRIAGVLTVAVMGGGIGILLLRERRKQARSADEVS